MKLQKLELIAFRGATQPFSLEFDPSKPITMLFGENGTGKSTISDALICLCTDAYGSLDDKSGVDKTYLVASGCAPSHLRLELHTDAGVFYARYSAKKITRSPASGQPRLRHLRRSSVVALSTAAPAARYEQLAEYFDLSGVVKSEEGLRNLVRSLKLESDRIVGTLFEVQRILEEIWRSEGSPRGDWQSWAESEMQKELHTESERLKKIRSLLESGQLAFQTAERLQNIREQGEQAAQKRQDAENQLAALQQSAGFDPALLGLLQQARDFVAAHADHETCPVCTQAVNTPELLSALDGRLGNMAALREASDTAAALRAEHERLQTLWQGALDDLVAHLARFAEQAALPECPPALVECIAELNAGNPTPRQLAERFRQMETRLSQLLTGQQITADAISKTLDQHQLIRENWKSVLSNRRLAEQNEQRLKAAERALKITENARKSFIDAELDAVSTAVDVMYQALHPGEQLGNIRLFLKEKGKNSLELSARFHGHTDITPQSVYSESHLDTLALCIFFALAKRYGGADTILLLDDVLSACDEAHLDRFVDLLHTEAPHFAHVIVTTHYRLWRDRYRQQRAPQNEIYLLELLPWSIQRGIRSQNGRNDLDQLRAALAPAAHFDRQRIANLAGTMLENMLEHLALRYQRPLPYRSRREYALRELLDCFPAKLTAVLRVERFARDPVTNKPDFSAPVSEYAVNDSLAALKPLAFIRNQVGAHFNVDGSQVSDREVTEFGAAVLILAENLLCPETGAFPDRDKSGSWLETRSGLVRLHPLQAPA